MPESYTAVTWATEDLITITKLNRMCGNSDYFNERYGALLFSDQDAVSTGSTTYAELWHAQFYLPAGVDALTFKFEMNSSNNSTVTSIKYKVETTETTEETTTSSTYTLKTLTLSMAAYSAGVKDLYCYGKIASGGTLCGLRNTAMVVSP